MATVNARSPSNQTTSKGRNEMPNDRGEHCGSPKKNIPHSTNSHSRHIRQDHRTTPVARTARTEQEMTRSTNNIRVRDHFHRHLQPKKTSARNIPSLLDLKIPVTRKTVKHHEEREESSNSVSSPTSSPSPSNRSMNEAPIMHAAPSPSHRFQNTPSPARHFNVQEIKNSGSFTTRSISLPIKPTAVHHAPRRILITPSHLTAPARPLPGSANTPSGSKSSPALLQPRPPPVMNNGHAEAIKKHIDARCSGEQSSLAAQYEAALLYEQYLLMHNKCPIISHHLHSPQSATSPKETNAGKKL